MQRTWVKVFLFSLWLFGAHAFAQHAAMVTDLEGRADIAGSSGKLSILSDIDPGMQVQLAVGARMVAVYLISGDEYAFAGPALVRFKADQPEVLSGARAQKRSTRMGQMGVALRVKPEGLAQAAIMMRSTKPAFEFKVLSLASSRVLETQPEFRWTSAGPGLTYNFQLRDGAGRTLLQRAVEGTSLRLPADAALKEGVPYAWEVSVRTPDNRYAASGEFAIATTSLRDRVAALRPAPDAPLSERVTFATWLEQMELRDEAHKYWLRAAGERPDDTRLKRLAAE